MTFNIFLLTIILFFISYGLIRQGATLWFKDLNEALKILKELKNGEQQDNRGIG